MYVCPHMYAYVHLPVYSCVWRSGVNNKWLLWSRPTLFFNLLLPLPEAGCIYWECLLEYVYGGSWPNKGQLTSSHLNESCNFTSSRACQLLTAPQRGLRVQEELPIPDKMLTGPVLYSFYAGIPCFCVVMSSRARSSTEDIVWKHFSCLQALTFLLLPLTCNIPQYLESVIQMSCSVLRNHQSLIIHHFCPLGNFAFTIAHCKKSLLSPRLRAPLVCGYDCY